MAYPAGVITRTVTCGGSAAVESGTDLVLSVSIEASRGLIRDGERMPSSPEVKTSIAGGEVSFTLPVSDQSGYRDEATGMVIDVSAPDSHTHTYTATITTTRGSKLVNQRVVNFPLPTGDLSPVDVDTLVDAGTVAGVLVSVPDTWGAMVESAEAAANLTVTTGTVVGDDLILTRLDTTTVNAGNVRGATGPANTLAVGTVTTGAPGSAAAAAVTGAAPNQALNLTIPRGDVGPANTLTIGTVTTLAAGAPATAGITGTAPNQTLGLGIPMGLTGAASDWLKVGPGDPRAPATTSGQITGTEPNGCTYISTDGGGVSIYRWEKRGGVWVDVRTPTEPWTNATLLNGWVNNGDGFAPVSYYRHAGRVYIRGVGTAGTVNAPIFALPAGYRPSGHALYPSPTGNVYIETDGSVTANGASTFHLGEISFRHA